MIEFRDKRAKELGMELLVYTNPEGIEMNINPFIHGSKVHTDIMKTEALKKALNKYGFDAIIGGARRNSWMLSFNGGYKFKC
nr:phosphoadenosine phosphosulfate reductase family protein [Lebetimonas sp. JS138]